MNTDQSRRLDPDFIRGFDMCYLWFVFDDVLTTLINISNYI
jgi:hypothetical protein